MYSIVNYLFFNFYTLLVLVDINSLGLLSLMGMLGSLIYIEVVQQGATEGAFGQHTLDGVLQNALHTERLLAQLSGCVEALATGIARVAGVNLVGLFLTSKDNLLGVDDDNVVTTVLVRSEGGLVLTADNLSHFRGEAAYTWSVASMTTHSFCSRAASLDTETVL